VPRKGRGRLLSTPVVDMDLDDLGDPRGLVKAMGAAGGFTGRKVAEAASILRDAFRGDGTTVLSFPAALMATGTRGLLRGLVERKLVDAVITTCGTADHDLARSWGDYYHGEFEMDDAALRRAGIHRLGNVLVPAEAYGPALEKRLQPMFREMHRAQKKWSTRELLWEIGRRVDDRSSFLHACWRNRIPVYVPAMFDGAVGSQLWLFWQDHKDFVLEEFRDEQELADLMFTAKEAHALMIGGGVSKHHTIWWAQFRGGLDSAVYITTAVEHDGSLSGARTREGISWGKLKPKARHVTIEADATLVLPMLLAASAPRRPT
jgi:deoxyhypusine synthase